jgi:(5-formylfuran-3-yl)methyl phosphate synthase
MAAEVGARGVLLDTWSKEGRDLFTWIAIHEVERWLEQSRRRGLLTALAGSLTVDGVRRAAGLPADVIGVRGAACAGGRSGRVDEGRVRALAAALMTPGRAAESVA